VAVIGERLFVSEEGSIGIGAMIVFIALILVAAVASTIIIKTAEELQQNAENTSSDTRQQISGKVAIADVFVKTAASPLCIDHSGQTWYPAPIGWDGGVCNPHYSGPDYYTDVATFEVIARVSSGSLNVQEGEIGWYITCKVTFVQWTPDVAPWSDPVEVIGTTSYSVIDYGLVDSKELGGTDIADGEEITAGTTFKFEIDLSPTNVDDEVGNVNEDIEEADFATSVTPGCDAEAGVGQELGLRIVVDGGGETLATLKIQSILPGDSVM